MLPNCISLAWLLVALKVINLIVLDHTLAQKSEDEAQPGDYSYSRDTSRVHNLVEFFENMKNVNSYDPEIREKQNVVISLSEAASKLRYIIDGLPLENKCNKYVKLISYPNIRTYSMVNMLAHEDKSFHEIEQKDSNLLSHLIDVRNFNALAKIQTLIQSLESERDKNRSTYEPIVQDELLNCINYFMYRHQRDTLGIIDYVREYKSKLEPFLVNISESDINLMKFKHLIDEIVCLENSEKDSFNGKEWLSKFIMLHQLVRENSFEISKLVEDFITDTNRLKRIDSMNETMIEVQKLQESIENLELNKAGLNLTEDSEYKSLLFDLYKITENNRNLLSDDSFLFVHKPTRWVLIEKLKASEIANLDPVVESTNNETLASEENINLADYGGEINLTIDCVYISNQLRNDLRTFRQLSSNIGQLLAVAERIFAFQFNCSNNKDQMIETSSDIRSNWTCFSLMIKLSNLCKVKLEDQLANEQDKMIILNILELLNQSRQKMKLS